MHRTQSLRTLSAFLLLLLLLLGTGLAMEATPSPPVTTFYQANISVAPPWTTGASLLPEADRVNLSDNTSPYKVEGAMLAPPYPQTDNIYQSGNMCVQLVTGVFTSTYTIFGPNHRLDEIQDYENASFSQSVIERGNEQVVVEFRTELELDTRVAYPLNIAWIPDAERPYLQPTSEQQSDDPVIVAQAQALVQDATTEARAVVAILDWVRANISYDYSLSLPNDAVSVYHNRSGVCRGFSNLAVALLRAVGIPARLQPGCALWSLPHGGGHIWIEVYYPDLGWISSEPQSSENYIDRHLVSERFGLWCGHESVTITRTAASTMQYQPWRLSTDYSDTNWWLMNSATIIDWDRYPLTFEPRSIMMIVAPGTAPVTRTLYIASNLCDDSSWEIIHSHLPDEGIAVWPQTGDAPANVFLQLDPSSFELGEHVFGLMARSPAGLGIIHRYLFIKILVVEDPVFVFLPLVYR